MALGFNFLEADRLTFLHGWQQGFLVREFRIRIVCAFDVGPKKPGEIDRLTTDLKDGPFTFDRNRDPSPPGVLHLARHRPFPNQLEQFELIGRQLTFERIGQAKRIARGTNCFVCLLGIADGGAIGTRLLRQVILAILLADELASRIDCNLG